MSEAVTAREREPFRWAGSKKHLIEKVQPLIVAHRAATGGGLVSLCHGRGDIERACGGAYVAADKSPELLALFDDLQKRGPSNVHGDLEAFDLVMPRTPEAYKALGHRDFDALPSEVTFFLAEAVRFLWLSAMAFNGVWRVNGAGLMNMGVDRARLLRRDVLPPIEAFRAYAEQISRTRFVEGWENALRLAERGDVLLVDPPYGEFDGYCAGGFGSRDHRLLASALREAVETRGLGVIAFNAPEAEGIYQHWAKCEPVTRPGNVSSDGDGRQRVSELIITAGLKGVES